jgi:BirA family biotin operon repressor/biotin-[acetyl-CoA-carboxylase] ligase
MDIGLDRNPGTGPVKAASAAAYDGLAPAALAALVRTPGLVCLPDVTSTLDELHQMAAQGAPAGTAVLADRQTAGRGRQGRPWRSPAGQGIWLAYLSRPATAAIGVLSVRVGLAVIRAAEALGARPRLKWPNDVMLGERKLAGVLCEARWDGGRPAWVAIGIGINVHGPLPADLRPGAATLDEAVPAGRVELLAQLLPLLHAVPQGEELSAGERREVESRDWLRGRRLIAPLAGMVMGIDGRGALVVETEGGRRHIGSGTVQVAG